MYNNNGIALLNRSYTATSSDVQYTQNYNNMVTFTDGTTNGNTILTLYHASTMPVSAIPPVVQKLTPTQKYNNNYVATSGVPATYDNKGYYHLGYRATPFTSDTYTDVTTISGLTTSASVTAGIPTITAYNTSDTDITVNEITYLICAGISTSTSKALLLAGFHFADLTIAPGETYTFTIMHKNS